MTKLINAATGGIIAGKLVMKDGFFSRLRGLLGVKKLDEGAGIILKPAPQIHTFFMLMPIDVVFISNNFEVLHVIEDMGPWRLSPFFTRAVYTVEIAGGALKGRLKKGDSVIFKD